MFGKKKIILFIGIAAIAIIIFIVLKKKNDEGSKGSGGDSDGDSGGDSDGDSDGDSGGYIYNPDAHMDEDYYKKLIRNGAGIDDLPNIVEARYTR